MFLPRDVSQQESLGRTLGSTALLHSCQLLFCSASFRATTDFFILQSRVPHGMGKDTLGRGRSLLQVGEVWGYLCHLGLHPGSLVLVCVLFWAMDGIFPECLGWLRAHTARFSLNHYSQFIICCDPTAQRTADISEYQYFGVHERGKLASENTESSRPCPCIFEASPFRSDCESGSLWIKPQSLSAPKRVQQKLFTSPFICHSLQNDWNITSKEKLGTTLTTKLLQVCDFALVNLHHHTQAQPKDLKSICPLRAVCRCVASTWPHPLLPDLKVHLHPSYSGPQP